MSVEQSLAVATFIITMVMAIIMRSWSIGGWAKTVDQALARGVEDLKTEKAERHAACAELKTAQDIDHSAWRHNIERTDAAMGDLRVRQAELQTEIRGMHRSRGLD